MSEVTKRLNYAVELSKPIKKTYIDTLFATEDNEAHRFEIALMRSGAAVELPSGAAVTAYFIRYADNATVTITGSASGNVASVVLSKACYSRIGQFALVIKVTDGASVSTVFYGEGSMVASSTDTIIDDENVIPSLSDLLAQIAAMEAATAAAKTATSSANSATSKANTATTNANAAATKANNAASAANTAAAAANAAAKDWGDSTAADSAKLGGKAPEYYIAPRNLLDNSDFTNPVNQRGFVSGDPLSAWCYFIDRWLVNEDTGNVLMNTNGLIPPKDGTWVFQKIEESRNHVGKTYTFAVGLSDGSVMTTSGIFPAGETDWYVFAYSENENIAIQQAKITNGRSFCLISAKTDVTVSWAALYEGEYTADTLPPYVPKGYAAELAECQRYYLFLKAPALPVTAWGSTTTQAAVTITLPVPMRAKYTAIIDTPEVFIDGSGNAMTLDSYTPLNMQTNSHCARIRTVTTTAWTKGDVGILIADVTLSADL